jgi:hypothetical protein
LRTNRAIDASRLKPMLELQEITRQNTLHETVTKRKKNKKHPIYRKSDLKEALYFMSYGNM